jgi:hypothetical protein
VINLRIELLNCTDDKVVVPKMYSDVMSIDCEVYEDCTIINPVIKIKNDSFDFKYINYVFIPDFGRYYFIDNYSIVDGFYLILNLSVDALNSFWNELKENKLHIVRNEYLYNMYLYDPLMTVTGRTNKQIKQFAAPSGGFIFNSSPTSVGHTYVLNSI